MEKREDLWLLHDEGYRRSVDKIMTFCCYALSPSTKEVLIFTSKASVPTEVRAYGPDDQMVSYDVPFWEPFAHSMLGALFEEMEKENKLGMR